MIIEVGRRPMMLGKSKKSKKEEEEEERKTDYIQP